MHNIKQIKTGISGDGIEFINTIPKGVGIENLPALIENPGKIDIIKKITSYHPGYGTDKGYSWYVGGMRDDGGWKWDVMVNVPEEELQKFLDYLIGQQKSVEEKYKKNLEELEKISKLPEDEQALFFKKRQEDHANELKIFFQRMETHLMWGK